MRSAAMLEIILGPSVLGLVAAVFFALSILLVRKGLDHADAATGTLVSIGCSTAVFWLIAPLYMEWRFWLTPAVLIFGAVGLFRPVISTYLSNAATKQLGPTIAATVGSVGPLFSVAGGVLLLGEPLGPATVLGTLGIVFGAMVLTSRGRGPRTWAKIALLLPLGSAMLRAGAHVMIKYGLELLPEPFMAGVAAYTVSFVVALLTTATAGSRWGAGRSGMRGVLWFGAAGTANALAIMALNVALQKGLLVLVGPLTATFPLFTLLLSALFFRQETINLRIMAGVVIITSGVIALLVLR